MSTGNATLDAVGAASGAATVELAVEWIVYLVIILVITALRTYARASIPGRSGFGWDDYLVWIAVVWYVILTAEVYVIGVTAVGIANDSMTDEYRARLAKDGPESQEFRLRVLGSKVQLAAWISYSLVLWLLKGSLLCFFVVRLTEGINGARTRAWIGTVLLVATWVSIVVTVLASCRPLNKMWQIFPDPGAVCYAGVSPVLIGVTLAGNILTDVYLISIPVPALLRASLGRVQKVSLVSLFSCSSLITAMAIVRVVVIVVNSNSNGDGAWALRECFVGMVTTNMAPIIPLFRKWLSPWLGRLESSSDGNTNQGTGAASSRAMKSRNRGPRSPGLKLMTTGRHHSSDSSEHIIDANDLEMRSYHSPDERDAPPSGLDRKPTGRSTRGGGSNSPTLIIQRNGEMLNAGGGAAAAAFHGDRPDRGVQVRDISMRERDFMN
ncbi:hypothetical protein KVR01_010527 [Diaporthe batatas]|uniref:uncharacterized protein n=1 Tax=Diaporthe batatas TaxID=748121 RepID=UPI001D056D1A|nr:uncharacterized protein KVR01_010527 [Diaporthe batatas]KAG8159890.1 hypothetical protein KVR01_010527 [Diaporthe batatas]